MEDWRQKFTTVLHDKVTLGFEAFDIHSVVNTLHKALLEDQPRANKVRVDYSILNKGRDVHHLATLSLLNVRGRVIDRALVWGDSPMVPTRQRHATGGDPITCACGSGLFYNVDRSLFYENHICAACGNSAQTLTETGAST